MPCQMAGWPLRASVADARGGKSGLQENTAPGNARRG